MNHNTGNTASRPDTADIVLFALHNGKPQVLLVQRSWDSDAYPGVWALPGGFVDEGETALQAAHRELHEETGLMAWALTRVGRYDAPGRDPRGPVVSEAFMTVLPIRHLPIAGDDARAALWVPLQPALEQPEVLAFDHHHILTDAHNLIHDQLGQQ